MAKNKGLLSLTPTLSFAGGWLRFPWPGLGRVYAHCDEIDGRIRVTQLFIDGDGEPLQAGALRRLPLGVVEAEVTEIEEVADRHDVPFNGDTLDLGAIARDFYAAGDRIAEKLRQLAGRTEEEVVFTLAAPDSGLTDEFLSDVGRAYRLAVRRGQSPALAIADQAGVPQRTAQSWIYKARKRGLMPPAPHRGRIV